MIGVTSLKKSAESFNQFFFLKKYALVVVSISMVATRFSTDTPNLVIEIKVTMEFLELVVGFLITGLMTVFTYAKLWRKSNVKTILNL